jgi:hypothetical protein
MLSKYEPVALAVLALGASVLMENRHRVDMTWPDRPPVRLAMPEPLCQPVVAPGATRFTSAGAFAAQGDAAIAAFGPDLVDGCAAGHAGYPVGFTTAFSFR